MLNQQTLEKLHAMRLRGMAEAFRAQSEQAGITELSFEERFALLVDQQWNWRQNRALELRLSKAKLRHRAAVEDIDFRSPRGLDRSLVRSLTQDSGWVREHQNIFLVGPTGIGKSFLACALAGKACRDGFTALYTRAPQLFRDLSLARADAVCARCSLGWPAWMCSWSTTGPWRPWLTSSAGTSWKSVRTAIRLAPRS